MGYQTGFNYLSDDQPVVAGAVVVAIEGIDGHLRRYSNRGQLEKQHWAVEGERSA